MEKLIPKYWIACSGGVDSVVLAHLFQRSKQSFGLLHMNFQLRGEASNQDAIFVEELAQELGVACRIKVVDVNKEREIKKGNTQLLARDLRYAWFEQVKKETNAKIVLAHHLNDQIETFFLQLERGGGVYGLAGMPIEVNGYVRPLLKYSKAELLQLAQVNNWSWREDSSNQSNKYERNFYRNEVIPFLSAKNEQFVKRTNELVEEYQKLLNHLKRWGGDSLFVKENCILFEKWNNQPQLVQKEILRRYEIPNNQLEEINRLQDGIKGGVLSYQKYSVWNEGTHYAFVLDVSDVILTVKQRIVAQNEVDFSNKGSFYIDADKVVGEIELRKWRIGDRFTPLGMKGSKLISDFLTDKKVPSYKRNNVRVLVNQLQIIAVVGFCPSEQVRINEQTKRILALTIEG